MAASIASSSVKKLYMFHPALSTCTTRIASLGQDEKGRFLRLTETIFHPQGGGQPFDTGTIRFNDQRIITVMSVQKEITPEDPDKNNFEIKHYVSPEDAELAVGDEVEISIDTQRRALNARLHSAGHLIAAIVEKHFGAYWKATAGHHIPREARVEFTPVNISSELSNEQIQKTLQEQLAAEINSDSSVEILITGTERQIKMGDYDAVPCGGTHVEKLSQLEAVEIKDVRIKSKKLRVSYEVIGE